MISGAIYRSDVCSNTMPGGWRLTDEGFISQHMFEGKLQTTVQSGNISPLKHVQRWNGLTTLRKPCLYTRESGWISLESAQVGT
jgi:hypothetical protein